MLGVLPVNENPAAMVGFAVAPVPPEKVELMANGVASAGSALLTNVNIATRVLVIVQVTANCAGVPVAGMTNPEKATAPSPVVAAGTTPPLVASTVPSPLVHCQKILNAVRVLFGGLASSPKVMAPLATASGVVVPLFPTLLAWTTPACSKSN